MKFLVPAAVAAVLLVLAGQGRITGHSFNPLSFIQEKRSQIESKVKAQNLATSGVLRRAEARLRRRAPGMRCQRGRRVLICRGRLAGRRVLCVARLRGQSTAPLRCHRRR